MKAIKKKKKKHILRHPQLSIYTIDLFMMAKRRHNGNDS